MYGDKDTDAIKKYEDTTCDPNDPDRCGGTVYLVCTNDKCKHKNIFPL